jgi:hypothetical protein
VQGTLHSRKQLFEELLWEHRDLVEAFAVLKLTHSQCQGLFELTGLFYTGIFLTTSSEMFLSRSRPAGSLP